MNPAVGLYRIGHACHRLGLERIGWAISWLNRLAFATMIPSSARIGRGFICGYWGLGVVIHARAEIGNDCTLAQNVTIGRNPGHDGVPRLGDRVYVGAGAVILGDIRVHDDAVIGANSVVNRDVPAGAIVAGVPARLLRMKPGFPDGSHGEPSGLAADAGEGR